MRAQLLLIEDDIWLAESYMRLLGDYDCRLVTSAAAAIDAIDDLLDSPKTSPHPNDTSTNLEPVLSDGDVPVGTSTAEKQVLGGDSEVGEVGILGESSKLPAIVVADMMLDHGLVIDLLHALQSYTDLTSLPIILCTSLAGQLKLSDLQQYGVVAILDKATLTPQRLRHVVASQLAKNLPVYGREGF